MTEVPLAEHGRLVAGTFEQFRDRDFFERQTEV
jgi:hypothetical protein